MRPDQSLDELSARILTSFGAALDEWKPDRVLVHGDTLTKILGKACKTLRRPLPILQTGRMWR